MWGRSTDALYEVLSLSLEHVGITSPARFGVCSKRCRELSKSICQHHTRQLLPPVVKPATITGLDTRYTDEKVVAAIDWVVACAGAAALAGPADILLAIPRVPQPYHSSSCDSLKALVQLPAAHGLPPSLMCDCLEQLVHVPGSDDLMKMYCSLENTDLIEYGWLASECGLTSVILTALQLRRVAAANSLSELTNFDDVSTQVLQDLLSAAVEQKQEGLAVKLCNGSSAQKLPCSEVVRLLHMATRQRLCNVVGCLLGLVADADLCAALASLIEDELNAAGRCTQHTASCILQKYIARDAAAPMPWSQIADLMCLAICKHKERAVVQLFKLSGAQDANACRLVNLVLHAALQRCDACMQPLPPPEQFMAAICQLPAAHHINAPMLESLMEAAVRGGGTQSLQQLCQLPAAAELGADVVVKLVVTALHCGTMGVAAVLSTLPGAALTTRQDLMLMLQTAIAQGDAMCVLAMLGCEVHGHHGSLLSRFGSSKSGAAEKLLTEDVAKLIFLCLQDGEVQQAPGYIEALSKLPAAKHLSPDQLLSFLQTAVKLDFDSELHSLQVNVYQSCVCCSVVSGAEFWCRVLVQSSGVVSAAEWFTRAVSALWFTRAVCAA